MRFQFTVRGFSKCDAAFVHYSLFESYSLSGPKVSSGAHQYLSNVQAGKSKRRETMVLKPRGNIDFHLLTTSVNAKYYY